MNNLKKIILIRDPERGSYSWQRSEGNVEDFTLLQLYFDSCVRYDPQRFSLIKQQILEGRTGCNDTGATIVDGMFQFYHDLIDFQEPRISKEDLLKLVEKWYQLVEAKVDQIVITNDNGKFSIGTE